MSAFLSFVISKTLSRGWGQQTKSLQGKHKYNSKQKLDKAKTKVKKKKKRKEEQTGRESETKRRREGAKSVMAGFVF